MMQVTRIRIIMTTTPRPIAPTSATGKLGFSVVVLIPPPTGLAISY